MKYTRSCNACKNVATKDFEAKKKYLSITTIAYRFSLIVANIQDMPIATKGFSFTYIMAIDSTEMNFEPTNSTQR